MVTETSPWTSSIRILSRTGFATTDSNSAQTSTFICFNPFKSCRSSFHPRLLASGDDILGCFALFNSATAMTSRALSSAVHRKSLSPRYTLLMRFRFDAFGHDGHAEALKTSMEVPRSTSALIGSRC